MRTRKVYLKAGYAYIPHQDIVTIVLNDFRTRLSKALAVSSLLDSFILFMTVTYIIMQNVWYSRVCPLLVFILITAFAFLLWALVFATTQWLKWLIVTHSELQSWLVHCFYCQAYPQIFVSLQIHSRKLNFTVFSTLQVHVYVNAFSLHGLPGSVQHICCLLQLLLPLVPRGQWSKCNVQMRGMCMTWNVLRKHVWTYSCRPAGYFFFTYLLIYLF